MHLSILVDSDDAYNSLAQAVARQDHRTRGDPVGSPSVGKSRPTEPVVVLGVQISYQVDVIGHGLLLASFSGFMIRVHHDVVLTAGQLGRAFVEVVEGHVVVAVIAASGLETEPERAQRAHGDDGQPLEPDQGCLLRQFVDRQISSREYRDLPKVP